ncbi:MAG TPA: hypothetical protein VII74_09105 [Chthoniobacterales bacterium]
MRCFFLLLLGLTITAPLAFAQEQESKLMDRIMRPNMSLTDPAQNRKFTAVEGTSVDKKFETKSFEDGREANTKSFLGLRSFLSKTFGSGKFARAESANEAVASADRAFASTEFATHKSALIRKASTDDKPVETRAYAGIRPFLAKGTRQQQLSTQPHPMTIEDVRELLNKN